ncbi:hypothetical protein GWE18_32475 [Bradyrhizobium sp. CSA112]|uniref:hypothetical protein n=1 Tax=Bradyrhizobium sp. CSA112 TaxID=2699170 RepID=UPI0023B1EBEE|nr:hypothetical protein [Bradyrhizobium sp. CSA112]MDE5457459.1 hypothetical protein [Bradyrhizobium sp. CSA112]
MRKFILIAGFVLASATAQAADRSLSLGVSETAPVATPKAAQGSKSAEAPQAAEAPKYVERPAVVEPKAETPKAEAPKPAARVEQPAAERSKAERARPAARRMASMSRTMKPRLTRRWVEARIVRELHRHGIYW